MPFDGTLFLDQVYAWGDNDHGQQGNGTTTVNRKPTLVQGLEGQKITRVACGSSHSVAWTTVDVTTPSVHEPVLFQTARDSLGASYLGNAFRILDTDIARLARVLTCLERPLLSSVSVKVSVYTSDEGGGAVVGSQ